MFYCTSESALQFFTFCSERYITLNNIIHCIFDRDHLLTIDRKKGTGSSQKQNECEATKVLPKTSMARILSKDL